MYTRDVNTPPAKLVINGHPQFGTFTGAPERLSIRGVHAPFAGLPFPTFLTDFRIKSRLSYLLNIDSYIAHVEFFDAKIFGFAEITFWDKSNGKKIAYRTFLGPRSRLVPRRLNKATCTSLKKSRKIKVSWNKEKNLVKLSFNLKGDSIRPTIQGKIEGQFSSPQSAEATTVIPWPRENRCSATYHLSGQAKANITFTSKNASKSLESQNICQEGLFFMDINRTLYKFHTKTEYLTALGTINSKSFSFRLSQNQEDAMEPEKYNDNLLFSAKEITPLPPVLITHSYGKDKNWIIQDTEGMVDLVFTPKSIQSHNINAIIVKSKYDAIYGTFEGTILDKDGNKYPIKDFPGVARYQDLRI